ncbi:MAG: DUF512 domain-containing protein [Lachnospiraceae bacterium]|nr:DUF512 domain-containing protein [Lachnospiraceae bacterium]
MKKHLITGIEEGSIAGEMEISAGDFLCAINGQEINDIFDYHYLVDDEELEILIEKADGEEWLLEVEKDPDEDLGLCFGESLMDSYKSCHNKCVFCFIDQNPPGMRETIYFKDDDTRLSFLQGNYVTLTNMKDEDIDRIINYRLAPINISVHTTNPKLRCDMLHNRFAGNILERMKKLYDAEIPMNAQIVLCKGYNDGTELDRTLNDLLEYAPVLQSVSVVPVGLTKYREGLCELEPFDKEDAIKVIGQIEAVQKKAFPKHGIYFAHASDEWYINAGMDFPDEENYDGYIQLENGVGMSRLFINETRDALDDYKDRQNDEDGSQSDACIKTLEVSTITGVLAEGIVSAVADRIGEAMRGVSVNVYPIKNDFFGERITVTGLLTGGDMAAQLKGKSLGRALILPSNVLKSDEQLFLDDMTVEELQKALQVQVIIVQSSGFSFVQVIEELLSGEITEAEPVIDLR